METKFIIFVATTVALLSNFTLGKDIDGLLRRRRSNEESSEETEPGPGARCVINDENKLRCKYYSYLKRTSMIIEIIVSLQYRWHMVLSF